VGRAGVIAISLFFWFRRGARLSEQVVQLSPAQGRPIRNEHCEDRKGEANEGTTGWQEKRNSNMRKCFDTGNRSPRPGASPAAFAARDASWNAERSSALAPAPMGGMGIAKNAQNHPAAARPENRLFSRFENDC